MRKLAFSLLLLAGCVTLPPARPGADMLATDYQTALHGMAKADDPKSKLRDAVRGADDAVKAAEDGLNYIRIANQYRTWHGSRPYIVDGQQKSADQVAAAIRDILPRAKLRGVELRLRAHLTVAVGLLALADKVPADAAGMKKGALEIKTAKMAIERGTKLVQAATRDGALPANAKVAITDKSALTAAEILHTFQQLEIQARQTEAALHAKFELALHNAYPHATPAQWAWLAKNGMPEAFPVRAMRKAGFIVRGDAKECWTVSGSGQFACWRANGAAAPGVQVTVPQGREEHASSASSSESSASSDSSDMAADDVSNEPSSDSSSTSSSSDSSSSDSSASSSDSSSSDSSSSDSSSSSEPASDSSGSNSEPAKAACLQDGQVVTNNDPCCSGSWHIANNEQVCCSGTACY